MGREGQDRQNDRQRQYEVQSNQHYSQGDQNQQYAHQQNAHQGERLDGKLQGTGPVDEHPRRGVGGPVGCSVE